MVFYNKGVKKKHKALSSSVIIPVLMVWLKRQVENILMFFDIFYERWQPKIKWASRVLTRVNTLCYEN